MDPRWSLSSPVQKTHPILDVSLYKILFCDERIFTIFLKSSQDLYRFSDIGEFINAMNSFRDDEETFDRFVRHYYPFLQNPHEEIKTNPQASQRLQGALSKFKESFHTSVVVPEKYRSDPLLYNLVKNLYSPINRRLQGFDLDTVLNNVPLEKRDWCIEVLNQINENFIEIYKEFLRDPFCTHYALKAYVDQKISHSQFVTVCLHWSVIATYDPTIETSQILKCETLAEFESEKPNDGLFEGIKLTQETAYESEKFVLKLTPYKANCRLQSSFESQPYPFFSEGDCWVIPSFTLLNNALLAAYGNDHPKPIVGLGYFSLSALAETTKTGDRPFQICMQGVGYPHSADDVLACTTEELSQHPSLYPINPSYWLHDLNHLHVLGAIPKEDRKLLSNLGYFIKNKVAPSHLSPKFLNDHKKAYATIFDMFFLSAYKANQGLYDSLYENVNKPWLKHPLLSKHLSRGFKNVLLEVLHAYPLIEGTLNEFLEQKNQELVDSAVI
jgi:hypothetical protein